MKWYILTAISIFLSTSLYVLGSCDETVQNSTPALSAPTWNGALSAEETAAGSMKVTVGSVSGLPYPKVFLYYAPKGTLPPESGSETEIKWQDAGWTLIADANDIIQGLGGEYLVYGVARNSQGDARSPVARVSIRAAIAPTEWKSSPQVDTSQVGQLTITPGIATGGEPIPSYRYYYAKQSQNIPFPPMGQDRVVDWLYLGWSALDTTDGLTLKMEAHAYDLVSVTDNGAASALRSKRIPFEVEGFPPIIDEDPIYTIVDGDFGRLSITKPVVRGNPTPTLEYYYAESGTNPPAQDTNSSADWAANWNVLTERQLITDKGWIILEPDTYDFYVVARNRYEPSVRSKKSRVDFPHLMTEWHTVQKNVPYAWSNRDSQAPDYFGAFLKLSNNRLLLTGGEFEETWTSDDGGETWQKFLKPSGLKGLMNGALVEHNYSIYYLGGNNVLYSHNQIKSNRVNTIYRSEDGGETFTQIQGTPSWPGLEQPQAVSVNNKIYLFGGVIPYGGVVIYDANTKKSYETSERIAINYVNPLIWSSVDGKTWEQEKNPPWFNRIIAQYDRVNITDFAGSTLQYYDGNFWFGGGKGGDDLWFSNDALNWQSANISLEDPITRIEMYISYYYPFALFKDYIWQLNFGTSTRRDQSFDNPVLKYINLSERVTKDHSFVPLSVLRSAGFYSTHLHDAYLDTYNLEEFSSGKISEYSIFNWIMYPWKDAETGSEELRILSLAHRSNYEPENLYGVRVFGLKWHSGANQ